MLSFPYFRGFPAKVSHKSSRCSRLNRWMHARSTRATALPVSTHMRTRQLGIVSAKHAFCTEALTRLSSASSNPSTPLSQSFASARNRGRAPGVRREPRVCRAPENCNKWLFSAHLGARSVWCNFESPTWWRLQARDRVRRKLRPVRIS